MSGLRQVHLLLPSGALPCHLGRQWGVATLATSWLEGRHIPDWMLEMKHLCYLGG